MDPLPSSRTTLPQPRSRTRMSPLPPPPTDDRMVHFVLEDEHPVALCGHVTTVPWDTEVDTAGRDRCPNCLRVLRARRLA